MLASQHAEAVLRIETIGQLDVLYGDRQIAISSLRAKAMLAYLAFADQPRESRRRLVGMFWGESESQRKAQQSLRHCISVLRKGFKRARCGVLGIDVRELRLDAKRVRVDILELVTSLEAGGLPERLQAVSEIDQAFLHELDGLDAEFDTWLNTQRSALMDRCRRALERQLADPLRSADHMEIARALLRLDPTHEEATRALINRHASVGEFAAALRVAQAHEDVLRNEHGTVPAPETRRLVAEVRARSRSDRAAAGAPDYVVRLKPRSERLVVTVAPFDVDGVGPARRYLCNGFRRELIASLFLFREWLVRDDVQPIAGEVPKDEYVLEAHASEAAGSLRIVFTLKEGGTNEYVWSERIMLTLPQWTDAHQRVVRQLAGSLNVSISEGRLKRVVPERRGAPLAFDQWLKGQALILSFHREHWHQARRIFEEVIEAAPDFGPAYSSRAQLENIIHLAHHGLMRDAEAESRALEYARKATALDRADSRAQLALAWSFLMLEKFDLAARHYDHAVRQNDTDSWTLASSGLGLAFSGEHDRAGRLADMALDLDIVAAPAQWGYLMRIRYLAGDIDGALEAMPRSPDVPAFPGWKCAILAHADRIEEARLELKRFYHVARQRWAGAEPWSESQTIRWFLHAFPLRKRTDWERVRDGLALAGAPVRGLRHRFWKR